MIVKTGLLLVLASELCGAIEADSEWVEYHSGTLPLILSVSHGGWLYPEEIDDRTNGCKTVREFVNFLGLMSARRMMSAKSDMWQIPEQRILVKVFTISLERNWTGSLI